MDVCEHPNFDLFFLIGKQWQLVLPLLHPRPCHAPRQRGRPPADPVVVLAGVRWISRTGAQWRELPGRFPAHQTCYRYFQLWVRNGTLRRILVASARDLEERGRLDLSACFIDATFVPAQKGRSRWPHQARQGHKDHGDRGQRFFTCQRIRP